MASAFNSSNPRYAKNFDLDRETNELLVYVRYEDDKVEVLVKGVRAKSPESLYKVDGAKAIKDFYLSLSSAVRASLVGVKLPDLYFKSDRTNADVVYFESHEHSEKADVFNYIHHMHDVLLEEGKEADETISVKNITDIEVIEKMINYQQETIDYLRPSVKVLSQAEQEIRNIFNYLENYKDVSKDYFINIVSKVDTA